MVEPELDNLVLGVESVESLKAVDIATDAVLAHADKCNSSKSAYEIRSACQHLTEDDGEPLQDDSPLAVSVVRTAD
ncbi:hypothetical protein [Haloarcula litorea]|uniref:hypothetical protein n=1 Tax=Haloarcula litorea TaxID=3032579 RepID=UPI0023E80E7E|nr:hypothetical protein [Halomicroarcula sp. GDY20]